MDKQYITNKDFNLLSIMFIAVSLVFSWANIANAEPGEHTQRMADVLNLSDSQRQQFKTIHRGARAEMMKMRDAMEDNREALKALSPEDKSYATKLAKLAADKGKLVQNKTIQRGQMRAKIYHILTPEQRQKAKKMKNNHPHFGGHGDKRTGAFSRDGRDRYDH